jgi:hypothetical protein
MFELGQLNLTDVVDDSPEVAVTLDAMDYGSIYTMATLFKVPTDNLHHNIRQSDGVTFYGDVGGFGDTSNGDLTASGFAGLPADSGTGIANIVIKDAPGGTALAYAHGVQLIDAGRECGISKGADIYAPVQAECKLGTADDDIEFTKFLKDVFINSVELNYQSEDNSSENYAGETEKKTWLLNSARFVSWEEFHVGPLTGEIDGTTMGAKTELQLSLDASFTVATLEKGSLAFLKQTETGRPALLFVFTSGGGLSLAESKAIPVFNKNECLPSNALEYFLYEPADNSLEYYANGVASPLSDALPAGRSAYITGDKIFAVYAADGYAEEDPGSKPAGADATITVGKYFAPISSVDVEDIGAVRQGQVEAYLVDPDLVLTTSLVGSTIGATSISFSGTLDSSVDLTRFIGLPFRITDGPGAGGPAREIVAATNSLSGDFNNGSITLGGADWSSIRLVEDTTEASTTTQVYVSDLCSVTEDYVGSDITVTVTGSQETVTISGVDVANKRIDLDSALSDLPDDGGEVFVSVEPTTASEAIVGDYQLSLRLQNVTFSADLTREALKELGHLNPYARTLTLPIEFSVSIDTTASDLETFATFAGKLNKFNNNELTDLDITDLFAKDNLAVVVMVYQQNDTEAGGTGLDRRVNNPDMFGDEYFVNGVRDVYTATDGTLTEYPLKTVIAQNLRITDEEYSLSLGDNATQTYAFRGTNELTQVRGYLDVDLVTKTIESQGE